MRHKWHHIQLHYLIKGNWRAKYFPIPDYTGYYLWDVGNDELVTYNSHPDDLVDVMAQEYCAQTGRPPLQPDQALDRFGNVISIGDLVMWETSSQHHNMPIGTVKKMTVKPVKVSRYGSMYAWRYGQAQTATCRRISDDRSSSLSSNADSMVKLPQEYLANYLK